MMIVKSVTVSIPAAVPSSLSVGEQQDGFVNEGLLLKKPLKTDKYSGMSA